MQPPPSPPSTTGNPPSTLAKIGVVISIISAVVAGGAVVVSAWTVHTNRNITASSNVYQMQVSAITDFLADSKTLLGIAVIPAGRTLETYTPAERRYTYDLNAGIYLPQLDGINKKMIRAAILSDSDFIVHMQRYVATLQTALERIRPSGVIYRQPNATDEDYTKGLRQILDPQPALQVEFQNFVNGARQALSAGQPLKL